MRGILRYLDFEILRAWGAAKLRPYCLGTEFFVAQFSSIGAQKRLQIWGKSGGGNQKWSVGI